MDGRERRAYVAAGIVAILLCGAVGTALATGPETTGTHPQTTDGVQPPAFVVDLQTDGSAAVTVTYTFDLSDEARRAAFEDLRTNDTAQQAFEERFRRQLENVASDASNATGREMSVSGVDVAFETSDGTGVVRLTATWDGLAATDGDRLTVTEPFASGFRPERPFAVALPDGYAVGSVSPAPDRQTDGLLTWSSGTSLDGFELTVGPADGDGDGGSASDDSDGQQGGDGSRDGGETPGDGGPGFGVLAGVLAVLGAALVAARRR